LPDATITATIDTVSCSDSTSTLSVPAADSYKWSTLETTQTIDVQPTANTVYSVTVTAANGCSTFGSITIYADLAKPVANITVDTNIVNCANSKAQLTATGGVSYAWSTMETTQDITVQPSSDQSYTVTVTAANGCTATAGRLITTDLDEPAAAILSADTVVNCLDSTEVLTATGGIIYKWSTNETIPAITVQPQSDQAYAVTVTAANGCTATASQLITADLSAPSATITANSDTATCANPTVQLDAGLHSSYRWSTGDTVQVINAVPPATITYSVTVSAANGCSASASKQIITANKPTVIVRNDTTIADCKTLLLSTTVTGEAPITYRWSDTVNLDDASTANPTLLTPAAGVSTYSITVTDNTGCTATDEIVVTVTPTAPISIGDTFKLCDADQDSAYISPGLGAGYTYNWSTGSTADHIWRKDTGIVWLDATDANGCVSRDSAVVMRYPLPQSIINGGQDTVEVCLGDMVTLEGRSSVNASLYIWNTTTTGDSTVISPVLSGPYYLTVTSNNGCTDNDMIYVKVHNVVPPAITGPYAPYVNSINQQYMITNYNATHDYNWSVQGGSIIADNSSSVDVEWGEDTLVSSYVQVVDSNTVTGCTSQSQYPIFLVSPAPLVLDYDVIPAGCNGSTSGSIVINSAAGGVEPYHVYLDSAEVGYGTIQGLAAGDYPLRVVDSLGTVINETATITQPLPLQIVLDSIPVSCYGYSDGAITITAYDGTPGYTYYVNGSVVSGGNATGLPAGMYTIVAEDANTCRDTVIKTLADPAAIEIEEKVSPAWCELKYDGSVEVIATGGSGMLSISWEGNYSGYELTNLRPGIYTYYISDANTGCTIADSVEITTEREECVRIPTAFSPNGDGVNDEWRMGQMQYFYPNATIEVYNRWGELVFNSKGYSFPWDGTYNGEPLPVDSYHFIIDFGNGEKPVVGQVTILK
jgi:gliding motility-associated-like protein